MLSRIRSVSVSETVDEIDHGWIDGRRFGTVSCGLYAECPVLKLVPPVESELAGLGMVNHQFMMCRFLDLQ